MPPIYIVLLTLLATAAVCIPVSVFIGVQYRKKIAEAKIGSAEEEAARIVSESELSAETRKKEILIEAKEESHRLRSEAEREIKDRRNEIVRQERRIQQREETLDKKIENNDKKEEQLTKKLQEADEIKASAEGVREEQMQVLQQISGFTVEQAKDYLLEKLESEITHESARRIAENEQRIKEVSEEKARNIISLAIQRCAADQVSETTVSVVSLPNDEMKGRIIGREGRNIRAIETLTGVDLIIDDTPEAITLSSFDPIRREIARLALEKLIADGRIHPARIEEMVEKARKEVEQSVKQAGEAATFETGVHGISSELVQILGKLRYRTSYGQNVLRHSIEVAHLSGMMAAELGVNVNVARRAGLLHDIGKAVDYEVDGSHVEIGVELAKKYKESRDVIHAIEAHHGDVEPQTVIAMIVSAADAISAARPGARRENLENYIKRLEKLEELANSFEGVEKSFAIQAGREIRIMVKPEMVSDDQMVMIAHEIVQKIENEMEYPGQIKVHMIRESRAVAFAR